MNEPDQTATHFQSGSSRGTLPKIAVACFSPNYGGMEQDAEWLARKIRDRYGQCLLIVRANTWLERHASQQGVDVRAVRFSGSFSLPGIIRLRRLLVEEGLETLVFFGASEMKTLHFAVPYTIRNFVVRHGTPKSHPKKDVLHRLIWSRVTAHWCISDYILENAKAIYPIGDAPLFKSYIALGGKADLLPEPLPLSASKQFRLVHVGRLEEAKGQVDLIKAVAQLRSRGIPAIVDFYGQGSQRKSLERLAKDLSVTDYVTFHGHVEAPYQYLGQYHAFVYPSRTDGFGNSFVEALCSGIKCFCYHNTCFPEFRELGFDYIMSESLNHSMLAKELEAFWRSCDGQPIENRTKARQIFSVENELNAAFPFLCSEADV